MVEIKPHDDSTLKNMVSVKHSQCVCPIPRFTSVLTKTAVTRQSRTVAPLISFVVLKVFKKDF